MSHPRIVDNSAALHAIRSRHLKQLALYDLVAPPRDVSNLAAKTRPTFEDMKKWTEDNYDQIRKAVDSLGYGGSFGAAMNIDTTFLAFMQSAAVDLRDPEKVAAAAQAYKNGNEDLAHELLEASIKPIQELAGMWKMGFVQICDLFESHPVGHPWLVGPYCGFFHPKPYAYFSATIAFKGTTASAEFFNDIGGAFTVRADPGNLWEAEVSKGFYYPLFSKYGPGEDTSPIYLIKKSVRDWIYNTVMFQSVVNVTGHSLGGAYATLYYAQLLIDGIPDCSITKGDLYTFGSPRVGRGAFAKALKSNVRSPGGSAWRIVNNKDPIPTVPASWPCTKDAFVHVDAGLKVFPYASPEPLKSEIGTHPGIGLSGLNKPDAHYLLEYYKSLVYAMTGKPPPRDAASRQLEFLRLVEKLGGVTGFRSHLDAFTLDSLSPVDPASFEHSATCQIQLDSVELVTRGEIRAGSFVGDLTAWGDATRITPTSIILHFGTWQSLINSENQWTIVSTNIPTELQILFTSNGDLTAVAVVKTGSAVEAPRIRGTCTWSLDDERLGEEILNRLAQVVSESFVRGFQKSATITAPGSLGELSAGSVVAE